MRKVFSLATLRRFWFHNAGEAYLCEGVTATSIVVLSFVLLFYICYLKRAADDATSFFQSCPVSKALSSLLLVWLTYKRALPLPPSSCCPLFFCFYIFCLQVQKRLRAEVSDGAVGQVPHAVNQHQHKLLKRNEALIESDNLHSHTPIAFAVFHPAWVLVPDDDIPYVSLHHRKHLLAYIPH